MGQALSRTWGGTSFYFRSFSTALSSSAWVCGNERWRCISTHNTCAHARTHASTHARTHARTHTHTHTPRVQDEPVKPRRPLLSGLRVNYHLCSSPRHPLQHCPLNWSAYARLHSSACPSAGLLCNNLVPSRSYPLGWNLTPTFLWRKV